MYHTGQVPSSHQPLCRHRIMAGREFFSSVLSKFSFPQRAEETKGTKCIKAPFCTHRSDYIPEKLFLEISLSTSTRPWLTTKLGTEGVRLQAKSKFIKNYYQQKHLFSGFYMDVGLQMLLKITLLHHLQVFIPQS